ncbi:MAG: ABC transporter permease [Treponema sp.]|jgi:ribose/xylose/arabinose/galactoside ABC-type transport system permease subunit|nr:ABC transporter permease [Treponema sp.]
MNLNKQTGASSPLAWILRSDEIGVVIPLLIIIAITTVIRHDFLTLGNFKAMFTQITFIGIVALGASIPLMVGNVDISTGRVAGLAGILMASLVVDHGWGAPGAILFGLFIALVAGALNGILVVYCNIPDFVATMGTLYIAGGSRYLFIKGYQLSLNTLPDFPLNAIFKARYLGMPIYFWIMLFLIIIMTVVIKRTVFGRQLLAAGDNREVAQLAGIKVPRVRMIAYMLSALFAGIAGILLTLDIGLGLPETGDGWEFRAIAGCVVGGTSLAGGKSSPLGTLIGVTLVFVAENAIIFIGLPTTMRIAIQGLLMALAVLLDMQRQRRKIPA